MGSRIYPQRQTFHEMVVHKLKARIEALPQDVSWSLRPGCTIL